MPKVSLKQELANLKALAAQYRDQQSRRKVIVHSVTDINTKDGRPQAVAIAELVASAKTAEILGYETKLEVTNGGKSIAVQFVERIPVLPLVMTL